ncbi:MAG: sulfatase-like hydrolase/transferase, partial [Anaerobacillus sp.]
ATRLPIQELLRENGYEFKRHYTGSAGVPSWSTFLTGQYPSLYKGTQSNGSGNALSDYDVSNSKRGAVPRIGDYFSAAGYRTYWKGMSIPSLEDISFQGTENALVGGSSNKSAIQNSGFKDYPDSGASDFASNKESDKSDQREHTIQVNGLVSVGENGKNMSSAEEVIDLLQQFEKEAENMPPWMIISSFMIPHRSDGIVEIKNNSTAVPFVHGIPGSEETVLIKKESALDATQNQNDQEVRKVFNALQHSRFYQDTIVLYVSHDGTVSSGRGELDPKHSNLSDEKTIVSMIIHNPVLFSVRQSTELLTSHVDIIPTLLALGGIDDEEVQAILSGEFTEVRPFVGRDLSPLLRGRKRFYRSNEPLYFMSDGRFTNRWKEIGAEPLTDAVVHYNQIEAILMMAQIGSDKEIWKYSRYYNYPEIEVNTCGKDTSVVQMEASPLGPDEYQSDSATFNSATLQDHYELYNLTKDPLEEKNLVNPAFATTETAEIQILLNMILAEQTRQKRLSPRHTK